MRRALILLLYCFSFAPIMQAQYTFHQHTFPLPYNGQVRTGDFNNDGALDVLVYAPEGISVLLNHSHGNFASPISTAMTGRIQALAVADLNHDGKLDLAVCTALSDATGSPLSYSIAVMLGNGDGTFAAGQTLIGIPNCAGIAAADFNGDGHIDLAVPWATVSATFAVNNGITVYFGDGAGQFSMGAVQQNIAAISPADDQGPCVFSAVLTGDFDLDGKSDLALGSHCIGNIVTGTGTLTIGKSDGTGHFIFAPQAAGGDFDQMLQVADLNRDGHPGVLVIEDSYGPHASYSSTLTFIHAAGSQFASQSVFDINCYACDVRNQVFGAVVADLNGDGGAEAIVGFTSGPDCCNPDQPGIAIMKSNGSGYTKVAGWNLDLYPYSLTSGDFDGDGHMDFAVVAASASNETPTLIVYLTEQAPPPPPPPPAGDFSVMLNPIAVTISAGQSQTVAVELAASNGFNNPVALACVAPPSGISCSFSASSAMPGNSALLTIVSAPLTANRTGRLNWTFAMWSTAGILGFCAMPAGSRRRARALLLIAAVGIASGLSACGSTGAFRVAPQSRQLQLVVMGSSGALQHSATVSVTIR